MSVPGARDEISPDLSRRLASGEALTLLDVRRPEERAFCAIPVPPTAIDIHIPMDEIPARLDEVRAALRRGPMVVYCHHGVRSRMVAEWLRGQGVSGAINLEGGSMRGRSASTRGAEVLMADFEFLQGGSAATDRNTESVIRGLRCADPPDKASGP